MQTFVFSCGVSVIFSIICKITVVITFSNCTMIQRNSITLQLNAQIRQDGLNKVRQSEGRKEMFYLTTHSTHLIDSYMERKGNVFNDALNIFYLRLYGVGHMVQDHSDSERGNPLPSHGLLFPINSKGSFICTITQTG